MTKQEQIEKMARTMCAYYTDDDKCALRKDVPCDNINSQECSYKEEAEILYDAGYGNIKQAQIEVLNELKAKYGFCSCYSWNYDAGCVDVQVKSLNVIIDEFIEEIK